MTIARISIAFSPLLTVFQVAPPSLLLYMPELCEPAYTTSAFSGATTSGNGNAEVPGIPSDGASSGAHEPPEFVLLNIDASSTSANSVVGSLRLIAIRVILGPKKDGSPSPVKVQVAPPSPLLSKPQSDPI